MHDPSDTADASDLVRDVAIPVGPGELEGELHIPAGARGIVLFAHGSGSSRRSPRNRCVAATLHRAGIGTLLFDLLTAEEEARDRNTAAYRFDIDLLARRLGEATRWVTARPETRHLGVGYFGASTGAAAALVAAAETPGEIDAVVSRGGRPDLAGDSLTQVAAPTLLLVGGDDDAVLALNEEAFDRLTCVRELVVVPGATHLFEEPGTLEEVSRLASAWFVRHLRPRAEPREARVGVRG